MSSVMTVELGTLQHMPCLMVEVPGRYALERRARPHRELSSVMLSSTCSASTRVFPGDVLSSSELGLTMRTVGCRAWSSRAQARPHHEDFRTLCHHTFSFIFYQAHDMQFLLSTICCLLFVMHNITHILHTLHLTCIACWAPCPHCKFAKSSSWLRDEDRGSTLEHTSTR